MVGLWTRLDDFERDELTRLIEKRRVVRSTMMRATQHLVTGAGLPLAAPVLQPMLDQRCRTTSGQRPRIDDDELLEAGRAMLEERPHTVTELKSRLAERWPKHQPTRTGLLDPAAAAARARAAARHVGMGGAVPAALAERISDVRSPRPARGRMILRYLAAFGPATVADVQEWSGSQGLRTASSGCARSCASCDDEAAASCSISRRARPDPDTARAAALPARVRQPDPRLRRSLRAMLDRRERRRRSGRGTACSPRRSSTVRVAATWKIARERATATLEIDPLRASREPDRGALVEEGSGCSPSPIPMWRRGACDSHPRHELDELALPEHGAGHRNAAEPVRAAQSRRAERDAAAGAGRAPPPGARATSAVAPAVQCALPRSENALRSGRARVERVEQLREHERRERHRARMLDRAGARDEAAGEAMRRAARACRSP
jgi:hypothetical protein